MCISDEAWLKRSLCHETSKYADIQPESDQLEACTGAGRMGEKDANINVKQVLLAVLLAWGGLLLMSRHSVTTLTLWHVLGITVGPERNCLLTIG